MSGAREDSFQIRTDRLLLTWSPARGGGAPINPAGAVPRIAEQTDYAIFLRAITDAPVSIHHRDPVLLRGLHRSDDGRVVYGAINFGAQVGRSTFVLRVGKDLEATLEVEVLPTKLDYEEDYAQLSAETQEILTGLVFEYLRSTFQLGLQTQSAHPTHLEWLMLLRHAADELEQAFEQIARHPHWGLTRDAQATRVERVKRTDAPLHRAVLRGAGTGRPLRMAAGYAVREQVQERRARPTLDTPEHRWLVSQLGHILRRLAQLRQGETRLPPSPRREQTLEEINTLEQRVARWARIEPLLVASSDLQPGFVSLQLLQAPGYREAYRACTLLGLGLSVEGGPVHLVLKDLHLLYEYWCYLTLVRLLAAEIGCRTPAAQLFAVERSGLKVLLRRGREQTVQFDAPGQRRVKLTYNPRFGGDSLLVPQQPDLLLEVGTRRLVLDAKYRIDTSPEYLRRYGAPGPPQDALNTLHRYRDALGVEQAVALFPYRESEPGRFDGSRLRGAIQEIGIGALPFLPGETAQVSGWLRNILNSGDLHVI